MVRQTDEIQHKQEALSNKKHQTKTKGPNGPFFIDYFVSPL